jgi:hypothetical protein
MTESISELVEREAADAERDDDETTAANAGSPAEPGAPAAVEADEAAPAEPAPEAPSDAAAEKALATIDKGAELGLRECPLCPIPGFVPAEPDPDVSPQQRLAVLSLLGEGMPVEYSPADNLHACEKCAGLGFLATGSNRDGFRDVECPECQGKGYVNEDHRAALGIVRPPPTPGFPPPAPVPYADQPTGLHGGPVIQGGHSFQLVPGGSPDQHGRLPGHPLWGQDVAAGGF